jgi:hypothetical protein
VYAKQLEDLPLEDIAKEMQDSWQLKVGPAARISAVCLCGAYCTHLLCTQNTVGQQRQTADA